MYSVGNLDILYDKPDEAEGAWMAVRGEGAPRDAAQVPYLSDVVVCNRGGRCQPNARCAYNTRPIP